MLAHFTFTRDNWLQPKLTEAHCRRVAALAYEIATLLEIPDDQRELVRATALTHHSKAPVLSAGPCQRLMNDVLDAEGQFDTDGTHDAVTPILEVAHGFDEGLEFSAYDYRSAAVVIEDLEDLAASGCLNAAAVQTLKALGVPKSALTEARLRLPVCPAALTRALAVIHDEDATYAKIERVVRTDQVLAASVLRVANSALFAPVSPISCIKRSLAHIGLETAKKVLLAAAARPVFASAALHGLWRHSLDVAFVAEDIARRGGSLDPGEAFVAGLLHDIGRLLIPLLPAVSASAHQRLAEGSGCPILADLTITGRDHGELGAAIIQDWGLPPALVVALEYHHRPELKRASLAPLLYLAEYVTGTDEDVLSFPRLKIAMDVVGVQSVSDLFYRNERIRGLANVLAV